MDNHEIGVADIGSGTTEVQTKGEEKESNVRTLSL